MNINKDKGYRITRVKHILERLNEIEAFVLIERNGLNDGIPKTLEETARILGYVSRERIRQIETKARKRLGGIEDNRGIFASLLDEFDRYVTDPLIVKRLIKIFPETARTRLNILVKEKMEFYKRSFRWSSTYTENARTLQVELYKAIIEECTKRVDKLSKK